MKRILGIIFLVVITGFFYRYSFVEAKPFLALLSKSGNALSLDVDVYCRIKIFLTVLTTIVLIFCIEPINKKLFFRSTLLKFPKNQLIFLKSDFKKLSAIKPVFGWQLLIIFILALIVRCYFLNEPIRHDEASTYVYYASQSWAGIFTQFTLLNNQILHSLLVKLSTLIFGNSEIAIRLPAFLAGLALIPIGFAVSYLVFQSESVALFAAASIASSSYLIEYSTNARGYSLISCLVLGLFYFTKKLVQNSYQLFWFFWVIFNFLTCAISPGGLYVIVFFNGLLLFEAYKKKQLVKIGYSLLIANTVIILAIILFYTPALIFLGKKILNTLSNAQPLTFVEYRQKILYESPRWFQAWTRDLPPFLTLLLILSFLLSLTVDSFFLIGLATTLLFSLVQRTFPFIRVWSVFLPLFYIQAFVFIKKIPQISSFFKKKLLGFLALFLCLLQSILVAYNYSIPYSEVGDSQTLRNPQEVLNYFKANLKPNEHVIFPFPDSIVGHYYFLTHQLNPNQTGELAKPGINNYLIINTLHDSLTSTLLTMNQQKTLITEQFTTPELKARFSYTEIYLLKNK